MPDKDNAGLLDNLVDGRTYQISTSDLPTGRVRWHMALYSQISAETAQLFELDPERRMWNEVTHLEADPPADGDYRSVALAWLAEVTGSAEADCVLFLPDVIERINRS